MSTISTLSSPPADRKKVTILTLLGKKKRNEVISMLTAYDYPTALSLDRTEIDVILVGDSLGMVVLGFENTLPVTMGEMLHHCRAVARGVSSALTVGDMPFMSFQVSDREAVRNAGRFLQEAGMDTVKIEGGRERSETIRSIVSAGIPVMGHIGLTPQSVHKLGGFRGQGRDAETAKRLLEDAIILQDAGCYSIVLEAIPSRLGKLISERLEIPTIGIGAGKHCDGQVLVTHDLLGLFDRFTPRFAKKYADFHAEMERAFSEFRMEVENKRFPEQEHSFDMPDDEWESLLNEIE
jgi:3-methyl-2-oxobutanoate hydroxymethyltransferase